MYQIELDPYFMKINNKYAGYIKIKVNTDIINDKQIILIIDISGSMCDNRIKYVVEAYNNLLKKINNKNILITLIVFNHDTNILYENIMIKDDNIEFYINTLKIIVPHGGTSICPSIELALIKKKKNYNCNIIIFTDGEDNDVLKYKNKIFELFTNETFHICGIGSDSIKLVNNLADCAKIKTINIIDNLEIINEILNNLLNYMNNNINDNIIINNKYYQLLNNQIKLIPLDPLDEILDYKINFKLTNKKIEVNCDLSNLQIFDKNCIETELERLNINLNIIMSNEIVKNNISKLDNIITEFNEKLEHLINICKQNSIIINTIKNYNKLVNDIELFKKNIDDIKNNKIDKYLLNDISQRTLSHANAQRSNSLIH
jgi:hypothetical protein